MKTIKYQSHIQIKTMNIKIELQVTIIQNVSILLEFIQSILYFKYYKILEKCLKKIAFTLNLSFKTADKLRKYKMKVFVALLFLATVINDSISFSIKNNGKTVINPAKHGNSFLKFHIIAETKKMVCYYESWAVYRWGAGKFSISNIN